MNGPTRAFKINDKFDVGLLSDPNVMCRVTAMHFWCNYDGQYNVARARFRFQVILSLFRRWQTFVTTRPGGVSAARVREQDA